jgi:hypothetical protein
MNFPNLEQSALGERTAARARVNGSLAPTQRNTPESR